MSSNHQYVTTSGVQTLEALEYVTRSVRPLGPTELAQLMGIHKNKAFRILQTLASHQWIVHVREGRFVPANRTLLLAANAVDAERLRLRDAANAAINLTELPCRKGIGGAA